MKKLRKRFNTSKNSVEQFVNCYCGNDCLCYCVPSSIYSTLRWSKYGNQEDHLTSIYE